MNEWYFFAAMVTAIGVAIPGILSYRNQRRIYMDEKAQSRKTDRRKQAETAVEGFSMLVGEMRKELDREKKNCNERVERVRKELLEELARIKAELQRVEQELVEAQLAGP